MGDPTALAGRGVREPRATSAARRTGVARRALCALRLAAAFPVVLGVLAGCAPAVPRDHVLRVALPIDPTSLSPLVAFEQDQIALDQLWCQTLVGLDERNRFVPILAARVPSRANGDISADGLRITYHLRRDVRFADGVPFTSADVVFTYRAIFEPANVTAAVDAYEEIAALTTPDAHTVVVRLRKPWGAAVHVLFAQADFAYGILPKHAFTSPKLTGSAWEQRPFGTGPFRVTAWRRGDGLDLEPNPYFRPAPKLKRMSLRIIPNETAELHALQTGEVDIADLNPDTLPEAQKMSSVQIVRLLENGLRAIYLQTAAEPTNDVRVRRAIAYAIDVPALSKAWRGIYPAARSVFPAPLLTWTARRPAPYSHDLARAGRELDAAGWHLSHGVRMKHGRPLVLLAAFDATVDVAARIALIVQGQLAPLGISVALKPYATDVFASASGPLRNGRFSFTPSSLIGGSDPEGSINLLCAQSHSGGANYARYCSPRFEARFDDQSTALGEAQRERDFDAMAQIVSDDVPLIPLYDLIYIQGVAGRVHGYARNMLRYPVRAELWDATGS